MSTEPSLLYDGGEGSVFIVLDAMLAFPFILLAFSVVSVLGAGRDKVIIVAPRSLE